MTTETARLDIVLVDGETEVPINSDALLLAMLVGLKDLHAVMLPLALQYQAEMTKGILHARITVSRVVRPDAGTGSLA